MDDEDIVRLSFILRDVSASGRAIDDLDEIPSWFQGPEEEVNAKAQEVREFFDEAYDNGIINRWIEEHARRGPSTNWDWTTAAHKRSQRIGINLTDPLGNVSLFDQVSKCITTPTEMVRTISIDRLDNDLCGHLNEVYEEQIRFVVTQRDKPVAAIVTIVDIEMLKDLQAETEPIRWLEWIQNLRERIGWPPVTFNEKEE